MEPNKDGQYIRILIVEDDPIHEDMLRTLLRSQWGKAHFRTAGTLAEAEALLAEEAHDLVLLGLNLPDSSGLDTLRTLSSQDLGLPPIIVVMGQHSLEDVSEAIRLGAQDFVIKGDVDAPRLIRTATAALERSRIRIARANYQELFQAIKDALLVAGTDRRITDCNPAFESMFGYTRDEVLGRTTEFIYEDQAEFERAGQVLGEKIGSCGNGETELMKFRKRNGEVFSGEVNLFGLCDAGGEIGSVGGIIRDISRRLEAEHELRSMSRRFMSMYEALEDGVFLVTPDREVLDVNPAAESIYGYSRDEMVGRDTAFLHLDEEHAAEFGRRIAEFFAKGQMARFDFQTLRKDGEIIPTEHTVTKVCDDEGNPVMLVSMVRDVTEQRRAEKAVAVNEERFRSLFERMGDGVGVYQAVDGGADFEFTDFNPAAERIDGMPREEVVGRRVTEVFPSIAEFGLLDMLAQVWKTGVPMEHPVSYYEDDRLKGWRANFVFKLPSDEVVAVYRDLTAQKQAEEALRETLLRQEEAVRAGRVGLWNWDLEADKVTYSKEWKRQIGYRDDEVGDSFEEWRNRVHPDDLEPTLAYIQKQIDGDTKNYEVEFRFRHKDGSWLWILAPGTIIRHEDGRAYRLLGSHVDVTESKQAEKALRESEAQLRSVGEMARVGGWELDPTTRHVTWTEQTRTIHEVGPDFDPDLSNALEFFHPDDRPTLEWAIGECVSHGKPYDLELRFTTARGNELWVRTKGEPVEEGGRIVRLKGSFQDVTERKRAELVLRETQDRYRGLFDSIRDAILVADTDRQIINCNPAFEDLFGYHLDEIRGKPTHYVYRDEKEAQEMGKRIEEHFSKGDGGGFLYLVRYRKKSGEVFPGETNVFFLRNAGGEVRGFIGLIRDITQRLQKEERLRRRAEMEALLSEAAVRLLAADFEEISSTGSGLLKEVCLFSGVDRCYLMNRVKHSPFMCLSAEWHSPELKPMGIHLPGEVDGKTSWWFAQLEAGAVIHINDVNMLSGIADAELRVLKERGVCSVLAVPIILKLGVEGFLSLESRREGHVWSDEDVLMLETLAGIIAIALERARAVADLDWNLSVKAALARLYKPIVSPFANFKTVARAILDRALEVTESPVGYVGSLDKETGELVVHTHSEMMHDHRCQVEGGARRIAFPPDDNGVYHALWGHSLNTGEPLVINAPQVHPQATGLPEGHLPIDCLLSMPVRLGSEVVGQITLANKADGFRERDVDVVRQMAEYYALALERLRSREKVEEVENRFMNVAESMLDGMVILDEAGTVSYANERMADMLGLTLPEIVGRSVFDFIAEAYRDSMQKALHETGHLDSQSIDMIWKGGGIGVETIVSRSPVTDESGRYRGSFCIVHDITERKQMEHQLLQAQKLESIGQLAAGVAHEINTPTQYVGNNIRFLQRTVEEMLHAHVELETLMEQCVKSCSAEDMQARLEAFKASHDFEFMAEELPEAINESIQGIERISAIVRSVKQFAHPGSRENTLVDLNDTVRNTILVSTNEWKYVAELQTDLDKDLPPVLCDDSEIKQVILNLIINAAHAIEEKLGTNSDGKGVITVSTRRDGDMLAIGVADTGAGIPEGVQERIFDPFFTTKVVGKGTGQGLSIAHTIVVERHGGRIDFKSTPGEGTTFTVRLPFGDSGGQA